ncbi:MAG: SGNH/GDSL hydrolase family protein [Nitrospirae bacterium]|nr:SGNH/GDSL hydrolase family protein [Nitrospirota bacterium]
MRIHNPFAFSVKGDKIVLSANEEYIIKNDKIKKLDSTIIFKTNSLGFRGEEPPKDFKTYLTTITVGGSTTKCAYLSEGKTWPDVLGRNLANAFKRSWINNAGLDGHSTYGHIILMEDYLKKLAPRNVLFLVGINDEGNNEYQKDFEDDKTIIRDEFYVKSLKGIGRALSNHSEVFAVGLNIFRYIKATKVGVDHDEEVDLNRSLVLDLPEEAISAALEKHKKFLKSYEMRLNKLIQISRENGIEPVFITQPALYGFGTDDITKRDLDRVYKRGTENGKLAWKRLELYNDVVRQVGKRESVLVIDLAEEMPKSSKYYYDFSHYTNDGAIKVAEIIFKHLCPFYEQKYKGFAVADCSVSKTDN